MKLAPIPNNERARLQALAELQILDTEDEEGYAAIVRLASHICGGSVALITLIDADRLWIKASVNMAGREAPRATSFCGHAIVQQETLVVQDALKDTRFYDNPFVVGAPHVRFYAGQRLTTPDGFAVGTLCVFDDTPRTLSPSQHEALQALALQASSLLELRLRVRQLEAEVEQRKRAEAAANIARRMADEARDAAEEANRAKSEFLARMSHELRTPLNAIIGFANVLQKNRAGGLGPNDLSYVERVSANGQHLLRLINDILDLAKVESGNDALEFGKVDLAELVSETVAELQGGVMANGRASSVMLIGEVPRPLASIESDRLRLKQILINLAGNALKFTEHGRIVVRVIADAAGVPVRIDVEDTGIGIPPGRLQAIFAAFEQGDSETAHRYGGTGLGLAISSTLAERLGYRITVESTVGAGSTFSVRLFHDAVAAGAGRISSRQVAAVDPQMP